MDAEDVSITSVTTIKLPYELEQEISIKFEEGLFDQAIGFLKELLSAAIARGGPIHEPNPKHLSLVATLAIHPNFTTRAKDAEAETISAAALEYLTAVSRALDPISAGYAEAFSWKSDFGRSLRRRDEVETDVQGLPEDDNFDDSTGELRSPYATSRSVWAAPDFWAVVGWAMHCSLAHPVRWREGWLPWMTYMVGVIESDWYHRRRDIDDSKSSSLIAKAIDNEATKSRALRAVLADGSEMIAREFKPLWKSETTALSVRIDTKEHQKQTLDISKEEYGDYMEVSSEDEEQVRKRPKRKGRSQSTRNDNVAEKTDSTSESTAIFGGYDAAHLRMRLLSLIVQLSEAFPETLGANYRFYDAVSVYTRPLPLAPFTFFIASANLDRFFPQELAISIRLHIASSFLMSGAKSHRKAGTMAFVEDLLPCTANTSLIVDNAKISIIVEMFIQKLVMAGRFKWSPQIVAKVGEGIAARNEKATKVKGIKGEASGSSGEAEDKFALQQSALRIKMLLDIAREQQLEAQKMVEEVLAS